MSNVMYRWCPTIFSYRVDQMEGNKGFIVDVKILICFDFDGHSTCIPTNDGLHLLKNQEIPLCDKNFSFDFNSKYINNNISGITFENDTVLLPTAKKLIISVFT